MPYTVTNITSARVALDKETLEPRGVNQLPIPIETELMIRLRQSGLIYYTGSDDSVMTNLAPIGCTATAVFTPTAGAYSAGDVIDIAKEFAFKFANGQDVPPGSLIRVTDTILSMDAVSLDASDGAYVLHTYRVSPPSAQADNAVWTLSSPDLPYYIDPVPLGTLVDLGAALRIKQTDLNINIKLTNSSAWGRLVTTPGLTMTAVPRQILLIGIVL